MKFQPFLSKSLWLGLISHFGLVKQGNGQNTTCNCSPRGFTWVLDFSNGCDPMNVSMGSGTGILDVSCTIQQLSNSNNDNVTPVRISEYTIFELDPDTLAAIPGSTVSANNLNLVSGDQISFTSIVSSGDLTILPAGLQTRFVGVTSEEVEVELSVILRYSGDCDQLVFYDGDNLGWLTFEDVLSPDGAYCTIAAETNAPSASIVTPAPMSNATPAPTSVPTTGTPPTSTSAPTAGVTSAPTAKKTVAPTPENSGGGSYYKTSKSEKSSKGSKGKSKGSKGSKGSYATKSNKMSKGGKGSKSEKIDSDTAMNKMKHKVKYNGRRTRRIS